MYYLGYFWIFHRLHTKVQYFNIDLMYSHLHYTYFLVFFFNLVYNGIMLSTNKCNLKFFFLIMIFSSVIFCLTSLFIIIYKLIDYNLIFLKYILISSCYQEHMLFFYFSNIFPNSNYLTYGHILKYRHQELECICIQETMGLNSMPK